MVNDLCRATVLPGNNHALQKCSEANTWLRQDQEEGAAWGLARQSPPGGRSFHPRSRSKKGVGLKGLKMTIATSSFKEPWYPTVSFASVFSPVMTAVGLFVGIFCFLFSAPWSWSWLLLAAVGSCSFEAGEVPDAFSFFAED